MWSRPMIRVARMQRKLFFILAVENGTWAKPLNSKFSGAWNGHSPSTNQHRNATRQSRNLTPCLEHPSESTSLPDTSYTQTT